MSGMPGLDPVETQVSGSTDQDVNIVSVGGTAVDPTSAAAGALGVIDLGTDAVPTFPGAPTTPWSYAAASGGIVNTTEVAIKGAPAGALVNYITSLQLINTDATVGTEVVLTDGSGGTVIWRGFAPASIAAVTQPIMADIHFVPPLFCTAATALYVKCITDSSQTYVNAQGYVA